MAQPQNLLCRRRRQERPRDGAQLVQQPALARKHVDAGSHRREHRHKVGGHAAQRGDDLRHGAGGKAVDLLHEDLRILQQFQGMLHRQAVVALDQQQRVAHARNIPGQAGKQHHKAAADLRQHQPAQQPQQQQRRQVGQQDGRPAQFGGAAHPGAVQRFDQRVEHKGDDDAPRKRRKDAQQRLHPAQHIVEVA